MPYLITGIATIIALPFILGLIVKKQYFIVREITIDKPREIVYDYVRLIKNQDFFSKWNLSDPEMEKEFQGIDGEPGFVYAWQGAKAGKGEQELIRLDGENVETEVRFIKPMPGTARVTFKTRAIGTERTSIAWEMTGYNPYPRNFINLFMNQMLGKDIETSLSNLKSLLENKIQLK